MYKPLLFLPLTQRHKGDYATTRAEYFRSVNILQVKKNCNKDIKSEDLKEFLSIQDNFLNNPINTIENSSKGTKSFDVTKSVQDWANGIDNNGWVFKGRENTIWNFKSSKWEGKSERPMLTVIY